MTNHFKYLVIIWLSKAVSIKDKTKILNISVVKLLLNLCNTDVLISLDQIPIC